MDSGRRRLKLMPASILRGLRMGASEIGAAFGRMPSRGTLR